jgi:hypothetical protein
VASLPGKKVVWSRNTVEYYTALKKSEWFPLYENRWNSTGSYHVSKISQMKKDRHHPFCLRCDIWVEKVKRNDTSVLGRRGEGGVLQMK